MSTRSIELYQAHKSVFDLYQSLLLKWNQKFNLTTIIHPNEVVERHFLDSLALIDVSRETFEIVSRETISLLDIGSGGGFPGLPLKIAFPSLNVTLVDSLKKRCDFLKEAIRTLSLRNTQVLHEKLAGQSIGLFDVIVSRATFRLSDYLKFALPNLKPQGTILALKGIDIDEEVKEAAKFLEGQGAFHIDSIPYQLPLTKLDRLGIVICRKT